jgi:hypothetical protein
LLRIANHLGTALAEARQILRSIIHTVAQDCSGDKARGHLGTEIRNKASTVLQIGFEKNGTGLQTELLKVAYLKCRNSRRHDPFYVQFSQEEMGLVRAEAGLVRQYERSRIVKAEHQEILEMLPVYLNGSMPRKQLLKVLCEELGCRERTIEKRLKDILSTKIEVIDKDGNRFELCKGYEDREVCYYLEPL